MSSNSSRNSRSDDRNNRQQEKSSLGSNLATLGIGVALGAAGALLWNSLSPQSERGHQNQNQPQEQYRVRPSGMSRPPPSPVESEKANDEEKCPICLESFSYLKKNCIDIVSLQCGHIYCQDCLYQAQRDSKRCPRCRLQIKENEIRKIFL